MSNLKQLMARLRPDWTRRRRLMRFLLIPAGLVFVALVGTIVFAFNAPLSNFEIDGDPSAGEQVGGAGGSTADGVDWARITSGAGGTEALVYNSSQPVVSGVNPSDNPAEPGTAVFSRDELKVDPDSTTFTQGDKENDFGTTSGPITGPLVSETPWHIVSGSVPPNKDDLFDVYTYTRLVGTQADVVLGLIRTNNNGSSHLDFELNKLSWVPCANDATRECPRRTEGDILVAYEITQGGAVSSVQFFRWDLPGGNDGGGQGRGTNSGKNCAGTLTGDTKPCPFEEVTFPASAVVSVLNQGAISAPPWGSRTSSGSATSTIPKFGFFETFLDFDALGFGPACPGFAQASVKSRSSGSSVDSALTDLDGPFGIDLTTCGKIIVEKQTIPDGAAGNFTYTGDAAGTISDNGTIAVDNLPPGAYTSSETDPGPAFKLDSIVCDDSDSSGSVNTNGAGGTATFNLQLGETVKCTFTNSRQPGSLLIRKVSSKTGNPLVGGATFHIGPALTGFDVTDDLSGDQNPTPGLVCVDGLAPGSYDVTEKSAPPNYTRDESTKTATVVAGKTCAGRSTSSGNEDARFVNIPLSKITVSFDSLAGNETTATVKCTGDTAFENLPEGTPKELNNLPPGTYDCQVVVDP